MISDASLPRCRECPTCANNDHNGVLVATTTKHSEKGWPHTQIRLLHILFVHYFVFYSRRCCLSRNVQQLFQRNAIPTNICTCSASVTSVLLIRVSLEIAFASFIPFHLCGILHEMVQNVQKGCRMPHILSVCVCVCYWREENSAKYASMWQCKVSAITILSMSGGRDSLNTTKPILSSSWMSPKLKSCVCELVWQLLYRACCGVSSDSM